ncbi:MAG: hypothetical protein GH147_06205 [Clostridia bacterium]|nr:hypothetical protein [Clostridia bacterium]
MMTHKKILFEMCFLDHIKNIEIQERTTITFHLKNGLSTILNNIHPTRSRVNMTIIAILFSLNQFLSIILKRY